jgi:hypothetical protein
MQHHPCQSNIFLSQLPSPSLISYTTSQPPLYLMKFLPTLWLLMNIHLNLTKEQHQFMKETIRAYTQVYLNNRV